MTIEQEKALNDHFTTINDQGDPVKPGSQDLRSLIFGILENASRIERELDRKDRGSKREIRKILKDLREQGFEAAKRIRG